MSIIFGLFKCVGKSHTVNKEGESKWKIKFEDDQDNKLTVAVEESTFDRFDMGDPLPWHMTRHQSTLMEGSQ